MKKQLLSTLAVATLSASIAFPAAAQNLAVVNGVAVPAARADQIETMLKKSGREVTPEIKEQIKQQLITQEVLVQQAKKDGIDKSPDYKTQLQQAADGLMIRELFNKYQKDHPVSDAAIKAQYDKVVGANAGKEYEASHILVESEDKAKDLIAQLNKGAKFEDLAKANSKDAGSGAKGGDLGWAPGSQYVAPFTDALTKLKKGETTQTPVKSEFGWHIIRLNDTRPITMPPLDQVKGQLEQMLSQEQLKKYEEELRAKAKIQ